MVEHLRKKNPVPFQDTINRFYKIQIFNGAKEVELKIFFCIIQATYQCFSHIIRRMGIRNRISF